jgi:hypothetical protein
MEEREREVKPALSAPSDARATNKYFASCWALRCGEMYKPAPCGGGRFEAKVTARADSARGSAPSSALGQAVPACTPRAWC